MKIEKLTKDNIGEFSRDLGIADSGLDRKINKLEYYGVKEEDKFYLAFIVLPDDDRIAIQFVSKKISDSKFLEFIDYLNYSLVVKNRLIVQVYEKRFIDILDGNYRCKDICVSNNNYSEDIDDNFKEKYAEIDMYNIKYLCSKDKVICNLLKQNIQDEEVIKRLHEYFSSLNIDRIDFIISTNLEELFYNMRYVCNYKSYVIENI